MKKRLLTLILALALLLALCAVPAQAKTIESARADNIFFYVLNAEGKSVLLKVMPLSELRQLSHGQPDGRNYYISTTDNYPTTQYCEGRGFTVMELLEHVKAVTTVPGANSIGFTGGDTLRLMATDSYGNYSRAWTARAHNRTATPGTAKRPTKRLSGVLRESLRGVVSGARA